MTTRARDWVDQLNMTIRATLPGRWEQVGRYRIEVDGTQVARVERQLDGVLVVEAINALPFLVMALRNVLDLADEWEQTALTRNDAGLIRAAIERAL